MKPTALLPLLALLLFACGRDSKPIGSPSQQQPAKLEMPQEYDRQNTTPAAGRAPKASNAPDPVLRYQGKEVRITKHGKCRMQCRLLDMQEIQDVLDNGRINVKKTGQNDKPGQCPTTAIEHKTRDGQNTRIIVSVCGDHCNLVTAIDLDTEHKCNCK